jgi:hypothetical protein
MSRREARKLPGGKLRGLLFTGAAIGAILAVVGVGTVAMAWVYPFALIDEKGANVTPDDLVASHQAQLVGTLAGLMLAAAGMAIAVVCFRMLDRDLQKRLRR